MSNTNIFLQMLFVVYMILFGAGAIPAISGAFLYALRNYGTTLILAILCATPAPKLLYARILKGRLSAAISILEIPALLAVLVIITAFLADGSFNPFLYFRF